MAIIHISEKVARAIEEVAKRENRPVDDVAGDVLEEHFLPQTSDAPEKKEEGVSALDALMGLFDDDITDMSSNVKEHLREYYRNKNDRPD
ncbi:MAG: hypothetical protein K8I30_12980 [Anaerolineae bacterium]|nr:hypothetical protein [Anaerolineae bacterium]